mmetsp:Transcript_2910/g.6740  ORF Transcript_2910/g.6740 Transcript_2910/m.6740 type:complete len:168 (-) Transcript_2910:192-695(-)|eukprot:CAMPEP_0178481186 /NCGR_PEP_ID=MMETSP0696-20121128/6080_1 /TAXON_ID=265572 /ORGANISM="Extubocellulus spinifer, Strain CCMP396" /LENGTH=167 /DNA_ID=CAMNT_0020108647 /DNA_START=146 /DNA_END=649 /DNA_ORIENTATION=-
MSRDMNEKMQLVPELRSPLAAYPMDRKKWLPPMAKTSDGKVGFIASPQPPKGETKQLKPDYVWGPGTRGFGYYHVLTKEAYVALEARMAKELAPTVSCCSGKSKDEDRDMEDLRYVHRIVVYPRSKSPIPKDTYALEHSVAEGRAAFVPPENKQWKEITNVKAVKLK